MSEVFSPRCGSDEVIIMQNASYGRMTIGTCVARNFGFVGCSTPVTSILDALCSGRQRCDVRVSGPELEAANVCDREMKTYLTAYFMCQKGRLVFSSSGSSVTICRLLYSKR